MWREFFQWWISQLKAWVPDQIKSRFHQELCLLLLDIEDGQVFIHTRFRNQNKEFGRVSIDRDEDSLPGLRLFLDELPRQPDRILVRIASGRYLSRTVELPLAAEENLSEAIGFQIEQLTPFPAEQVLVFSGIQERLPAEKKIRAWLLVTPTDQVESALQLLGGSPPSPVQMPEKPPGEGKPLQIVFRPFGQRDSGNFRGSLALSLLLLLSTAGVFYLHVTNRLQTLEHLESAVLDARSEAADASRLRTAIEQSSERAGQLTQLQSDTQRFLPVWNDLSERLDDETWLQRLDLRDEKLTLSGLSGNASGLLQPLQDSPFLEQVAFGSSVMRDRNSEQDRFSINAEIAPVSEANP